MDSTIYVPLIAMISQSIIKQQEDIYQKKMAAYRRIWSVQTVKPTNKSYPNLPTNMQKDRDKPVAVAVSVYQGTLFSFLFFK
jgi:hypothetical protein